MKTRDELIEQYGAAFTAARGYRAGALRAVGDAAGTYSADASPEAKAFAAQIGASVGQVVAGLPYCSHTAEEQRNLALTNKSPDAALMEKVAPLIYAWRKVATELSTVSAEDKARIVGLR